MRCRDAAKRKAIRTKNPLDWANYRKLRNRINDKVKTTKASYYHSSFTQSRGNARRTSKTINNLMSHRQNNQIIKEVKVNGISISNPNEIPNAFNKHVSTIGPRLARETLLTSDDVSIYLNNMQYYWKIATNSVFIQPLSNRSDKDLTLETSAFKALYGGQ